MKNKLLELRAHITNLDWDGVFVTCNRNSLLKEIDAIIELYEAKTLSKPDVSGTVCLHPNDKRVDWHDSAILCSECNCIIEQFGQSINPPHKL